MFDLRLAGNRIERAPAWQGREGVMVTLYWKCRFRHAWRRTQFWTEDNKYYVHLVGLFECERCGIKDCLHVTLK